MNKTQDFTKVMQDMMQSLPFDAKSAQGVFKTTAAFGEKMTKVALEAAEKSNEVSSQWAKQTIAKVGSLSQVKDEATDYTKAFGDFASAAAEMAAENLAAFAEIAKKVQLDTVELMLAAGKTASEDAAAAVQKATTEVTNVAKKAAAAAK